MLDAENPQIDVVFSHLNPKKSVSESYENPIKIRSKSPMKFHQIPIGRCLNLMKIPHFLSHGDPASVVALQQPPTDLDGSAAPAVAELKKFIRIEDIG
jgi:hypothetical protein